MYNTNSPDSNLIPFYLTEAQTDAICTHFGKRKELLTEEQICMLLDEVIDRLD
jgi:hypothetical protein